MVVEWYKLPIADPAACRTLVNYLLKDDFFLNETVNLEGGPRTIWFTVEKIVKRNLPTFSPMCAVWASSRIRRTTSALCVGPQFF